MFERFTEKAIKIVTLAQQEAISLNHQRLYPEHLLLGILREGTGLSARLLKASGVDAEYLSEKINQSLVIKQSEKTLTTQPAFSSSVKRVLKEAWDEARIRGVNYIGSEHIFLALLNPENTTISNLLDESDVDVDRIKTSILKTTEKRARTLSHPEAQQKQSYLSTKYSTVQSIVNEDGSKDIIKGAKELLQNTKYEALGTEQIFLSLLGNKDCYLSGILEAEGINEHSFNEKLAETQSREAEYDEAGCLFTYSAFETINSAYEIAKELGSSSVKSEHILLGIIKEKKGLAYEFLKEKNIDIEALYKKIVTPIEKQKPVTLTIIKLAKEEARRLGHNVVGTELMLLGILGEGTCLAANVLQNLGITLKDARIEVEKLIGYGDSYLGKEMIFSPRAKKLLEIAWTKAKKFNRPKIESEHVLLAIIKEKDCMAMKILEMFGVDVIEIRQGIMKAIEEKDFTVLNNEDI